MFALEIKHVCKSFFGNQVLSDINMDVRKGEVHGLVGENGAGKSTLVKIIGGIYEKDSGDIFIEGQKVHFTHPLHAMQAGISIVHQELSLVPNATVAENIYLRREITNRFGFNDWKSINARADEVFKKIGIDIDPAEYVEKLSVGMQQLVEVAKAIALDARLLIMDEPTSSLSEKEIAELFAVINGLREHEISIIFISHKLSELFEIADRITVLRDGELVDTVDAASVDRNAIIRMMVGRPLEDLYPPRGSGNGEVIFACEQLSRYGYVKDVNFEVRQGEIVCLAGLVGAGRTEAMRALINADARRSGRFFLHGAEIQIADPKDAMRQGIYYLPEDRKGSGLFLMFDMALNIAASSLRMFEFFFGLLSQKRMRQKTLDFIGQMDIRPTNPDLRVFDLSGGNQQKVMISKALTTEPRVLIVDEPTRGVDIGAKSLIHQKLRALASRGVGMIVVSSEMPEVLGLSDRVLVFRNGSISASLDNQQGQVTQEEIIHNATEIY